MNEKASGTTAPEMIEKEVLKLGLGATEVSTEEQARRKARREQQEELLARLAEVGGRLTAEEDIIHRGTQIVIPETMELKTAISFMLEKLKEDEREVTFVREFKYRPWDGARATMRALKKAFGMVHQKSTFGFWGEEINPALITIPIGVDETDQIPWGALAVPPLPGTTLYLEMKRHPELGMLFQLKAEGPRKFRHHIEGLFRLVADELAKESLYRGKAFDGQESPEFIDLSGVDPAKVIYSQEVLTQLNANVWSLIEHRVKMTALGIPMKRAVLFEGKFGTGKTLGAYLTALYATRNGWTFIYCRPGRDSLTEVMATARLYQPAVVFCEDVDTVGGPAEGDKDRVAELLDIFDGLQAKGTEIICVLTTNHVEKIHKGMIRPGRLDAVIHIGSLDHAGVRRMVEANVRPDLLADGIDWETVAVAMDDFLPAFIREAVDRALRYNVARNNGDVTVLGTEDFVAAANGLRPQLLLMEGAKETVSVDSVDRAIGNVVAKTIEGTKLVDEGDYEVGRLVLADQNGHTID